MVLGGDGHKERAEAYFLQDFFFGSFLLYPGQKK
jgi:hypothetical protein